MKNLVFKVALIVATIAALMLPASAKQAAFAEEICLPTNILEETLEDHKLSLLFYGKSKKPNEVVAVFLNREHKVFMVWVVDQQKACLDQAASNMELNKDTFRKIFRDLAGVAA